MLQHESDARIKSIWELHLDMEIAQLQEACGLLRKYEGVEPTELLPKELPEVPLTFEPNKEYVRAILADQIELRTDGLNYVPLDQLPADHRYFAYQKVVNAGGELGEEVIDANRAAQGREYRDETEGPNPIADLRESADVRR